MKRLAFLGFLGLAACSNVLGLDDYTDGVDANADTSPVDANVIVDANPIRDATFDADVIDANVVDAPPDVGVPDVGAPDACVPSGAEICSDGVDNDCNGKTDCSDLACTTGFSCIPPLPLGWAFTAYAPAARPSCTGAFAAPTDVAEGIIAPAATCGCGCTFVAPTCTTGNLAITAGTSGVNGCQNGANQAQSATATCASLSPMLDLDNGWQVNATPPAPTGGSCAPTPSVVKAPVSFASLGRTCGFAGNLGGGCTGGDVCVAKAAPLSMCVTKSGDATCPAAYPIKHTAGTTASDTRGCTACTCALVPGTCGGTVLLYDDPQCNHVPSTVAADAACHVVAKQNYKRYSYVPQSTASCTSSSATPTGDATFADARTICCMN